MKLKKILARQRKVKIKNVLNGYVKLTDTTFESTVIDSKNIDRNK